MSHNTPLSDAPRLTQKFGRETTTILTQGAIAQDYRVQMIPTQIFFDAKGKEVKRHMGFMEKADILKELKAAGLK